MSGPDDETFLKRWARRKRDGEVTAVRTEPAGTPDASEPEFDPATLPRIEDLLPTGDITAFLRKGVPEELKRLALRKAWSLDPAIRDFVEVAENQYDWNVPGGVPGFGELPAGTDIEALLAQATGQVLAVDEPQAATPATGEPATLVEPAVVLASETAFTDPGTEHPDLAIVQPVQKLEPVASAPRRRHGGALPR